MIRTAVFASVLFALAACEPQGPEPLADAVLVKPTCYTVDLYDDPYGRNEIQPAKEGLPQTWNRYLGVWGNSAWNGQQCHEIYVTEVFQDGSAVVIDTTAPFGPLRAESHRRPGFINEAGNLVVFANGRRVVYFWEDGRLRGQRERTDGQFDQVLLSRKSA
ncbi:hypothetical protein [Pontivivens ytuae]|uniref:Lipoprotein n=1 Tax=Pontivivens ytuae TaxID=2789856 RepID=A0A7S9LR24_9RHOB|nr:hypothetical protein [Pontivivens ytuae]QPH53175.1 hypothetical protein I0K15_15405 [Pontivivens ytuae]